MVIRIPWWVVYACGWLMFAVACAFADINFFTWKGLTVFIPFILTVVSSAHMAREDERTKASAKR
jgi:uncharacterized membrane protein